MARDRIGVMGGSFNPIHMGHYCMAEAALKEAALTKVLFIPSGMPPHKRIIEATGNERLQMVTAAIGRNKQFTPSRIELDREGTIYSVDTLTLLREQYPQGDLFFIIGEDTLYELKTWYRYETVFTLCTFLVVHRQMDELDKKSFDETIEDLNKMNAHIIKVPMTPYNASSTEIRQQLAQGALPDTLCAAVKAYIALKGLYGYLPWIRDTSPMLDRLYKDLSAARFAHSLSVCLYARELAQIHGVDIYKATVAGLLHDCAKCFPVQVQRQIIMQNHLTNDSSLLDSDALMHGLAGEFIAKTEYNISDTEILSAITCHTTGRNDMSKLDMVVYLADKAESGRKPYNGLQTLRDLCRSDLREAVVYSIQSTVEHLIDNSKEVHPMIYDTLSGLQQVK